VTFGGNPVQGVDGNCFVKWCGTMIAPSPGRPEVEFTADAVVGGMQNVFTDSPDDVFALNGFGSPISSIGKT